MSVEGLANRFLDEHPQFGSGDTVSLDVTSSRAEIRRGPDHAVIERRTSKSIHYVEITDGARSARLDYPLLAALIIEGGDRVDVPLPGADGLPSRYHYQALLFQRPATSLVDVEPDLRTVEVDVANPRLWHGPSGVERMLRYELEAPFGYEDMAMVVADTLLLAGPADPGQCVGPHGREFSGPCAPPDKDIEAALSINFPICRGCLDLLGGTGMPLAPSRPKEW